MSRTRRLSAVLFFFTLYPALLSATILNPAVLDDLEQQQRDRLKQSLRQREELERTQPFQPSSPNTKTVIPGSCFILHTVTFDGAEHLSGYRRHQLTSGFIGQCLNLSQINQLIKNVSNWYIQQGYITSRAFLTEQDLSQGQLNITVLEGKLETITLDGESPLSLTMAFSHLKGKILNLRDIEQGMEQINRVRRVPVKIEILPGNQVGYSVINLTAKPEFPIRFNAGFSNQGQKNTGSEQLNAILTANNLFGLAERWSVGGARSSAFSHAHNAQSLQTGVSIPYGYGLFDYNYSDSHYVNIINNKGKDWRSSGNAKTHHVTGNWTLYRDSDMKTSLMLGLTHRNNHNELRGKRLNGSSYILTSATLGINHGQRFGGGFATFNPSVNRGIPYLGSESDDSKISSFPKAEFTKWTLATSYYLPVTTNLVYLTSLYGQWASDRLYGSERLTIGGESSVRGFKEQRIDGNNGCYWRNELNWTLFSWPIGPVGVIAALDTGYLQHDLHEAHDSGKLWGGAVGLFSTGQTLSSQLTVGLPLSYPGWLTPDRISVYYRIGLEF